MTGDDAMGKIENAVAMAEQIAGDERHGYDQVHRMGDPDYDCSSLVILCCEKSGIPVWTKGARYTGNMRDVFLKTGFKDVRSSVDFSNGSGMKRGDVLLGNGHTAFYCGNGSLVHASKNEKGGTKGGKAGDQTGKEICIRPYYNKPWTSVLRYVGENGSPTPPDKGAAAEDVSKASYKVGTVYTLRTRLKVRAGAGTEYSQKNHGELSPDGQKHDSSGTWCLDAGTKVTCLEIQKKGADVWLRCRSGWLAAHYNGKRYIQ